MRSPHHRVPTERYSNPPRKSLWPASADGFSLVELLVTIVLAGIIFGAMVPFFANALVSSSRDAARNDAQTIIVDRIDQIRLLNYDDISAANLNTPPSPVSDFGDGRFGQTYTLASGKVFSILYEVALLADTKRVVVHVKPSGSSATTTMSTVVKDPAPNIAVATAGPTPSVLPTTNLSITVTFKNAADVTAGTSTNQGVYYVRTPATGTPYTLFPHASPSGTPTKAVKFIGLDGGMGYTYTVTCHTSNGAFTSPPFHLLKSGRLYFDTRPGQ
jgi:prepilin-type N-terminal cleavage/methylation domain-containing protein